MTPERYFSAFNVLPMPKGSIFLDSWKWIASWYRDFDLPMKWCQEVYEDYRTKGMEWLKMDHGDPRVWEMVRNLKRSSTRVPKALATSDLLILFVVFLGLSVLSVCIFVLTDMRLVFCNLTAPMGNKRVVHSLAQATEVETCL